jgi:hypothetical protein
MIIFGGRGFAEIGENQGAHRFGRIVEQRAIVTAQRRLADADVPGDDGLRIAGAGHRLDGRQRLSILGYGALGMGRRCRKLRVIGAASVWPTACWTSPGKKAPADGGPAGAYG